MLGELPCSEKNKNLKFVVIWRIMCIFVAMKGYSGYVDEDGNYNVSLYCEWFEYHLHNYHVLKDGSKMYEGISLEQFAIRHNNSVVDFIDNIKELIEDKELTEIEEEINNKLKIKLDMTNFFMLCVFINEFIREHYLVLLKKPTKDAIEELGEIKEITFTDKEGKTVTTNCTKLIEAIMSASAEPLKTEGDVMETEIMGRYDKLTNIVEANVLQSKFAYYVASFLKNAFPDAHRSHRGKQGFISPIEQRLILRLMSYFGLAPKGYTLTTDRFRKLMESYNKLNFPIQYAQMPEVGLVPITYVKYEDWKNKINWFDPNLELRPMEEGDCVYFNPKPLI